MIDTKTLACCRSPDTSARVTVTPFTRGSFSSNRMVSLATSRMTSRTRARRWVFIQGQPWSLAVPGDRILHVQFTINEFRHRVPAQRLGDDLQRVADRLHLAADQGEPQHRASVLVQRIHLSGGHAELVAQPVEDA